MARSLVQVPVVLPNGNVVKGASVTLYEEDGVTLLAQTLYAAASGGTTLSNPLTTDDYGLAQAYADTPQRAVASAGGASMVIDIAEDPADTVLGSFVNPMTTLNDLIKGGASGVPTRMATGTANELLHGLNTWGSVATADIAANAVSKLWYCVGTASNPSTTFNTYQLIPQLDTGSITTSGGDLLAVVFGSFYTSAQPDNVSLAVRLDSDAQVKVAGNAGTFANYTFQMAGSTLFTGVSAGSHQVRAYWATQQGGTLVAYEANPRQMWVLELKR